MPSPLSRRVTVIATGTLGLLASSGGLARADLRDSVERVTRAWSSAGAMVVVEGTRFIKDGETLVVPLPEAPDAECTTVVLMGARGLGFYATLGEEQGDATSGRIESEAGAVSIELCAQSPPRQLAVTSESG
ncbi:MAG: hypothetical protein ACREJ3_07080, partial [Polyangiaceae bacterium]